MKLFAQKCTGYLRGRSRKTSYHRYLKKAKIRYERRRAKQNPQRVPGYGRYYGYEY